MCRVWRRVAQLVNRGQSIREASHLPTPSPCDSGFRTPPATGGVVMASVRSCPQTRAVLDQDLYAEVRRGLRRAVRRPLVGQGCTRAKPFLTPRHGIVGSCLGDEGSPDRTILRVAVDPLAGNNTPRVGPSGNSKSGDLACGASTFGHCRDAAPSPRPLERTAWPCLMLDALPYLSGSRSHDVESSEGTDTSEHDRRRRPDARSVSGVEASGQG